MSPRRFVSEYGALSLQLIFLAVVIIGVIWTVVRGVAPLPAPKLTQEDSALIAAADEKVRQQSTDMSAQLTVPSRLIMPTINVALDIEDSSIQVETNEWPLSDDAVHFANFTSRLGEDRGTMLLYGHNTQQLLRSTQDLQFGDEMSLVDERGKVWRFAFVDEKIITPEQVEFIYEDVPFRVVMFTCNGWADQYRRLMYFELVTS